MATLWNEIAQAYNAELLTKCDDLHFGVGIPGNRTLGIVKPISGGVAVELGCGSGENLIALHYLGYRPIGVDASDSQLQLAQNTLTEFNLAFPLIVADVSHEGGVHLTESADLVISVGVGHFCPSLNDFILNCSSLLKPGGQLVLSLPHPLDMIAQMEEVDGQKRIVVESYYPDERRITNAHYWRRFAGHVPLVDSMAEYICRPSDLLNALISANFEICGLWEPEYSVETNVPCAFKRPDAWFSTNFYPNIPQYLIVKALLKGKGGKS